MPLNTQLSSGFSNHIDAYLERVFLDILRGDLVLANMGMKKTLPSHYGTTVKWNRWSDFAADVTALTEAETPTGKTLTSTSVTATVAQYGNYVTVSDWFQLTAINDTLMDATGLLARLAARSKDALIRNELDANGTQNYVTPGTNSSKANVESNQTLIQTEDLKTMLKKLRNGNVPTFEDGNYRGILHVLMEYDLLSETGNSDIIQLVSQSTTGRLERGEIGTILGMKLMRTTESVRADATSTNTYGNIFLGQKAFASVDIASAGVEIIRKPHGSAGTEDPLNQRATVGYKFNDAAKVLEATRAQILWAYNGG